MARPHMPLPELLSRGWEASGPGCSQGWLPGLAPPTGMTRPAHRFRVIQTVVAKEQLHHWEVLPATVEFEQGFGHLIDGVFFFQAVGIRTVQICEYRHHIQVDQFVNHSELDIL